VNPRARRRVGEPPLVWLMQRTDAAGGVTVIVDALVDFLADRRAWRVRKVVQRSQADSYVFRRLPRWRRALGHAAAAARLASALLRERPDLVVTFTPAYGAAAAWLARRYGGRSVLTHHLQRDAIRPGASRMVTWGERRDLFDATIACSASVAADFPETRRMRVVVNGVPDVRERALPGVDRAWLARLHGVPEGGRLAFAAGRLAPVKGHEVILDALSAAPDWRFVIAGDGPSRADLAARAVRLGVAERFHMLGRVEGPVVWSLMRLADAYVQPSRAEGLSLALLEAFAMGAVVLASPIPPNREAVEPHDAGLLPSEAGAAAWAGALSRLVVEPDLAPRLRAHARAAFEGTFHQQRMLEGYERVMVEVLERS
jgi:glycosyltransferase involved in cell wall biosynthesis